MSKRAKKKAARKESDPAATYRKFRALLDVVPDVGNDGEMPISVVEEIVSKIDTGCSKADAARTLGVSPQTFARWMKLGRKEMTKYWDGKMAKAEVSRYGILAYVVDSKYAQINSRLTSVVYEAAMEGNVQAAVKALRWRTPEEYNEEVVAAAATASGDSEDAVNEHEHARNELLRKMENIDQRHATADKVDEG